MMCIGEVEYLYSAEEQAHCFTHGCQTALQDGSPTSLTEATVDGERAEAWSQAPDVIEGHIGKVYPPVHSGTTSKKARETFVAAVLTTVEASVRGSPHTVARVDAVWLSQHVLKRYLDVVVNIVWVPHVQVRPIVANLS